MSPEPVAFPKTWDSGIKLPPQSRQEDCWADCLAGVLTYIGISVDQDALRSSIVGDTDVPLPIQYVQPIVTKYGAMCVGPDAPLSVLRLKEEMTTDPAPRPVLVAYLWYPPRSGGHFALVTGYREWTGRFIIADPFFGPGELSYPEIVGGYGIGEWCFSFGQFKRT